MPAINYLTPDISYGHGSEYGKPIHNLDQFSDETVQIAAVIGLLFITIVVYAWWKQRSKKKGDELRDFRLHRNDV